MSKFLIIHLILIFITISSITHFLLNVGEYNNENIVSSNIIPYDSLYNNPYNFSKGIPPTMNLDTINYRLPYIYIYDNTPPTTFLGSIESIFAIIGTILNLILGIIQLKNNNKKD